MTMLNINEIVRDEVSRQVPLAVRHELTPSFLESFYTQMIFETKLNKAVKDLMPGILQQNNSIVSQFVQLHMVSILNQQHYFQSGIIKQSEQFNNALKKQSERYQTAENRLVPKLEDVTHKLIKESIKNVSTQNFIVNQLKVVITEDVKLHLADEVKVLNTKVDELNNNVKWGYTLSGAIGAGVGCVFTYVLNNQ
jgi:hypothetical protein